MKLSLIGARLKNERLVAYLEIALGCVIGGAAYPLFLVPNNIAPGGLTGIATIFNYLWGWPVGVTSMALNLPLFVIGYKAMGRVFAFRSLVATLLFSACIEAYKKVEPILYGYVDFETEYPKAIAELEAAGINEYVAEVNRQLAEFMAK